MRKSVLFVVFCCIVASNVLADSYTLDKRRYVTDALWKQEPYSYVLKLRHKTGRSPFCTANMIGGKIVTAKHCMSGKNIQDIVFIAYNGRAMCAQKGLVGNYVEDNASTYNGDWAVFTPCAKDAGFVKENSLDFYGLTIPVSAMVDRVSYLGYGALKIMSDEEIDKFRRAYYAFLYDKSSNKNNQRRDFYVSYMATINAGKGINVGTKQGKEFLKNLDKYGLNPNIFSDTDRLKESKCVIKKDPNKTLTLNDLDCQSWGGNSGGGLYMVGFAKDVMGNIIREAHFDSFVGIHTRGSKIVGGKGHANNGAGLDVTVSNFSQYLD